MSTNQDDKTKKFIEEAKSIVDKGIEPTYKAIADKIGWHNNSLSLALKGKRNIPFEIYKKFLEIYKQSTEQEQKEDYKEDYKQKYTTLLEEHLKIKKALERGLGDIIEKQDIMRKELTELKHQQLVAAALQISFQEHWLDYFYPDKDKRDARRESISQKAFDSLIQMEQMGIDSGAGTDRRNK